MAREGMAGRSLGAGDRQQRLPPCSQARGTAVNDAAAIAATLRQLQFGVLERRDLNRATVGSIARGPRWGRHGDGGRSRMKRRRWGLAAIVLLTAPFAPVGP